MQNCSCPQWQQCCEYNTLSSLLCLLATILTEKQTATANQLRATEWQTSSNQPKLQHIDWAAFARRGVQKIEVAPRHLQPLEMTCHGSAVYITEQAYVSSVVQHQHYSGSTVVAWACLLVMAWLHAAAACRLQHRTRCYKIADGLLQPGTKPGGCSWGSS